MDTFTINWEKYSEYNSECENCGNDIDICYKIQDILNSHSEIELRKIQKYKCYDIDQACDTCYFSHFFEGARKQLLNELIEEYINYKFYEFQKSNEYSVN